MGQEIEAGKAVVRVGVDDQVDAGMDKVEARMKRFASAALVIGAKLSGLGLGLGAGLIASAKSFADVGSKLDEVNKKLASTDSTSEEFQKLTKEAAKLNKILGGESIENAIKLGESFEGLQDSLSGVISKVGAVAGPAIGKIVDYIAQAVDSVTTFIDRNRALVPQAVLVASAVITAGLAVAALGTTFYAFGPIAKLAMLTATIASYAFSAAVAVVTATVAVASAAVKILSVTLTAASLAVRIVTATLGVFGAIVKAASIFVAIQTGLLILWATGYGTVATALRILLITTRLGTVAGLALTAVWAAGGIVSLAYSAAVTAISIAMTLASVAASLFAGGLGLVTGNILAVGIAVALAVAGIALIGIGFKLAGDVIRSAISAVVSFVQSQFAALLAYLGSIGDGVSSAFDGFLANVTNVFNQIVTAGQQAFESAKAFFYDLLDVGKETFKGISDAIEAGNIQLAMDILWTGLRIAWIKGVDFLKSSWKTASIWIEGVFDDVGTSLKTIWDVSIAYLEGAFDKFILYIRNAMQDAWAFITETLASLDPTGFVFNLEATQAANAAATEQINAGAQQREDERNNNVANAGDDAGARQRREERERQLREAGQVSPELAALQAQLAGLNAQAATEKEEQQLKLKKLMDEGKQGALAGAKLSTSDVAVSAKVRGSSEAASAIAKFANAGGGTTAEQQLAESKMLNKKLEEAKKLLADIAKQKPVKVNVVD